MKEIRVVWKPRQAAEEGKEVEEEKSDKKRHRHRKKKVAEKEELDIDHPVNVM